MTAPERRGAGPRHRAEPGGRLQRRAAAPEGVRGAVPVPRRPAGLPGLGRVRRLGLRASAARRRQPAADGRRTSPSGWRRSSATTPTQSIIGWCPLNETHQLLHDRITQLDDVTRAMFLATKATDTTRPVLDASGYAHRVPETDVYDSHNYEQDPDRRSRSQMAGLADGRAVREHRRHDGRPISLPYARPALLRAASSAASGGTRRRRPPADGRSRDSWGYGERVARRGGVLRPLRGADRRAARRPADVRLLLHAADRRVPGAERHLPLRPHHQARRTADPGSPARQAAYEKD